MPPWFGFLPIGKGDSLLNDLARTGDTMDLFPHERHRLDDIDGYLGGQEPRLASMFDIFTRLTREDGEPPAERQFLAAGTWRARAFACHRARRRRLLLLTAYAAALIAVLIAAIFY